MTQDAIKKQTLIESAQTSVVKKVPPHDLGSESCVLGNLLMFPEKISSVNAVLEARDFYSKKHQTIYSAILSLFGENKQVDLVTVGSLLGENKTLDEAGGSAYLASLLDGVPKTMKIEFHVNIIKEKSRLRRLARAAYDALQSCYVSNAKPKDISSKLIIEVNPLAAGRDSEPNRLLSADVKTWVKNSAGEFSRLDIRNDLNLTSTKDRHNLVVILGRMEKEGTIVRSGKREGHYRRVEDDLLPMEWENADVSELPISWPFDIHDFFITYKKSVLVVAGKKSEGKTLFCLDFARRNVDKFKVHYFTNELGPQGVRVRTGRFKDVPLDLWKKINFYERCENYEDAVAPNDINIIDYLEVGTDFYQMGHIIRKIHKKLVDGVALIAIQKKEGATYGVGGEFTTHAAQLYLTLDVRRATIIYAKNVRDGMPSYDGRVRKVRIIGGAEFEAEGQWEYPNYDDKKMRF